MSLGGDKIRPSYFKTSLTIKPYYILEMFTRIYKVQKGQKL